jgi:hypothetical protein
MPAKTAHTTVCVMFAALFALSLAGSDTAAWAARTKGPAPKERIDELPGPAAPMAPAPLVVPQLTEGFQCDQYFTFKGRAVTCDSNVRMDAENLRPIIRDTPAAIAELDAYQSNRIGVKNAAYVGSAGLLIALGGVFLSRHFDDNQVLVRNLSLAAGLALAAGSFGYALAVLQTNEAHLGKAVNFYNAGHPDAPIELQFSTGLKF